MLDKRFGESDPTLSLEERMFMRFQKEKVKSVRNSSAFNLESGDTEILTHKGQLLGDSNLDDHDWVSSDEEADAGDKKGSKGKGGALDKQVVDSLHFGGGLQYKGEGGVGAEDGMQPRKGRLDALQEIVMKSKLHKMQKKEAKEEMEEERSKLDKAYDDLFRGSMLDFNAKGKDRDSREGSDGKKSFSRDGAGSGVSGGGLNGEELDDYDQALKEMSYEARLPASERTKSAEEVALEEQKRIEELEEARLKRMRQVSHAGGGNNSKGGKSGEDNSAASGGNNNKRKHRTDDEIDDDNFQSINRARMNAQTTKAAAKAAAAGSGDNADAYNEYIRLGEGEDEEEDDEDSGSEEEDGDEEDDDEEEEEEEGEGSGSEAEDDDDEEDDNDVAVVAGGGIEDEEYSDSDDEEEEEVVPVKPTAAAKKGTASGVKFSATTLEADVKTNKKADFAASATAAPALKSALKATSNKPKNINPDDMSDGEDDDVDAAEDDGVNVDMPHKIDCPPDLEAFDELVEQYVVNVSHDMGVLIDRILAWNNVHLPGAEGRENRNLMHNFLDVLIKHFIRVGDSLAVLDVDLQKETLQQVSF